MRKDSSWRHHPHSGSLHKNASSSHSHTGKYSLTVPLLLPPRLSRLLRIPCKHKLNRRLVDEYEHHGGVSSPSSLPLHDQRANASDGLSSDERPNQSDSSSSCSSSSSQAPNDGDEIFIPSSPRPKARTLPSQPLIAPPWSPPSSPSSSESSSSSSFDQDEPTIRGRPPFARTRSYQQLPDCFSKSRDPLLWYSDESPSLKRELQHHRSFGALESRYSRHATPPPPPSPATGMLQKKYGGDRGSYDDNASLREKRRRDEIWREFFEDAPQLGSSRETSTSTSSSGSVWGSSRLPSIPTWKRIDDDDDGDDDEVDELLDEEPACLFRSDEERGAITSQRGNEASQTRLPSISEWYKVVEEYDEDYDENEEDYDEDEEEDELAYELTRSESSRYERAVSVPPWAQEPQKPPPSKELSPESERKLQMIVYSRSLSKRGLKPAGYVASPLGPDWKKPPVAHSS